MTGKTTEEPSRRDRIIDVAIRLAAEGGFENVRQRDVAAQAGVALGTLYRSFRSKEDILTAAMDRETSQLRDRLAAKPLSSDRPVERVVELFERLTESICRKPSYARAVLRTMTSSDPAVVQNILSHQATVTEMVLTALASGADLKAGALPRPHQLELALLLQQIWFAALVGWSIGLTNQTTVTAQVRAATELWWDGLVARGLESD